MGKTVTVSTGYRPREFQQILHRSMRRFNVLVCHRRFGKTVLAINELIDRVLRCQYQSPRVAYLAPLRKQAKKAAWMYVKRYTDAIPGRSYREDELRVDLPGDRQLYIEGADNPDALRGIYLDAAVLDEFGQMSPSVWGEVIRPTLADRQGAAIFIGTPKGRNAFHTLYDGALNGFLREDGTRRPIDPEWFAAVYRASETGVLPEHEIESLKRSMDEAEFAQELECSFEAAIVGAYYSKIMAEATASGRIGRVPWEPNLPVHTGWDLGIGDSTAIWFAQQLGREVRLIDYYEMSGMGLDHYAKILASKPYVYGDNLVPHDADARELGSGKTRVETLRGLGVKVRVVPLHAVEDGINASRNLLRRCWFDQIACARGIEMLRNYRREWDDKLGVFRPRPLHDFASHGADAFRCLAMGLDEQQDRRNQDIALSEYDPYNPRERPSSMRHGQAQFGYDELA